MPFSPLLSLRCPLDGGQLTQEKTRLYCSAGHNFDIAKQGYVNLLPVQFKKSKSPGDSKQMVEARTHFLQAGYYKPISAMLNDAVLALCQAGQTMRIMDAGCGEGYYLDQLYSAINHSGLSVKFSLLGIDISKPAVISACKRSKFIDWIVASNKSPPVMAHSVDIIICMFGFYDSNIFSNALATNGHLILVEPGPRHLLELREVIYPSIKSSIDKAECHGFNLIDMQHLEYQITLNQEQICNLLVMTPHFFRAPVEGKGKAMELDQITVTVDVSLRLMQAV